MLKVVLTLTISLFVLSCNRPQIVIAPNDRSAAEPDPDPQDLMRASVTLVTEKLREVWVPSKHAWERSQVDIREYPGLYLGNGLILTTSLAESQTSTATRVRYQLPDGTTATVAAKTIDRTLPDAPDFILMRTGEDLPIPEPYLDDGLPALEEWVVAGQCEGMIGSVDLMWDEHQFSIWLSNREGCECRAGEAVYAPDDGSVLGVCDGHSLWSFWQPTGFGPVVYSTLSARYIEKLVNSHRSETD